MNEKKVTRHDVDVVYQIPVETHSESEQMPRSKEKEVAQGYPSDTSSTGISQPASKDYTKDKQTDLTYFESKEETKTDVYGLSKPKRKIIKGKIFHDRD